MSDFTSRKLLTIFGCLVASILTGFTSVASATHSGAEAGDVQLRIATTPLNAPAEPCTGSFVATTLDHITTVPGDMVDHYEANGAGVAIGDLDNDGDQDIVLANHAGPNTILWLTWSTRSTRPIRKSCRTCSRWQPERQAIRMQPGRAASTPWAGAGRPSLAISIRTDCWTCTWSTG